jgi:monoamine oxidase
MVKEVQRQLASIHGLSFSTDAQDAAYTDWGEEPFGRGWNNWSIGVKSSEVKEQIIQPFDGKRDYQDQPLNIPLYICGEAHSDAQGWVEGVLQTADLALATFGVEPPTARRTARTCAAKA